MFRVTVSKSNFKAIEKLLVLCTGKSNQSLLHSFVFSHERVLMEL